MEIIKEISKEYSDIDDFEDNLDFYRNMMNLREFEIIFNHEKLIESELLLFLSKDLPEYIPFFYYINWKSIEPYKDDINKSKLIDFEKLDITKNTIKDINSLFKNDNKEEKSKSFQSISEKVNKSDNKSKSKNKSGFNKTNESKDSNNLSISKENTSKNESNENNKFEETKLNDSDLKLKDTIETVKYAPYNADNRVIGSLFEGDILNYIYDILYILSSGKVNMMRNKKYKYKNVDYELDFQIVNLNLKYFLYFIALLYPNISNIDTLGASLSNIFKEDDNIFKIIDNLEINGQLKEYEYIDILGEVTIDYLNIDDKKNEQFEKYKSLIKQLQDTKTDNKLFGYMEKNKKIILVITNGKFESFYEKFKKKKSIAISDEVNYLFIYVNKKVDESKIIKEKLIFNYINLLENKLEEYSRKEKKELEKEQTIEDNIEKKRANKIEEKKDEKNNEKIENNIEEKKQENNQENAEEKKQKNREENLLKKYKYLELSKINNNFYEKINSSRKFESFQSCLKKINKGYINKLPKLFFTYMDKNLKFDIYENQLKNLFNYQFNEKAIFEKLNAQYEKEKNKINISLFEISSNEFYYKNYKNDSIKIVNYKNADADKEDDDNFDKFKEELQGWFDVNSKSENVINIIIMNFEKFNKYGLLIINDLTFKVKNGKDYILFYKNEDWIPTSLKSVEKIKIDKIEEILNLEIIKLKAKKLFMKKKLRLFLNYVDRLFEKKIITNDEKENESKTYLDELVFKINQEWAIFYNYDICKFYVNAIDVNKLKQLINEIYSKINVSGFKNDIINLIINKLNKNLSFMNKDNNSELRDKIINIYKIKFNSEKSFFSNIFYKYFEKKYTDIKKIMKNDFINQFLDKIKYK